MLVLPTLPVMPTTRSRQPPARPRGQVQQRLRRVGDLDRPSRRRRRGGPAGRAPRRRRPRRRRRGSRDRRARRRSATNSSPGCSERRVEARRRASSTSGPTSRATGGRGDLGCQEPHGGNGTVVLDGAPADGSHLVVLFGGQSAEHDVSCVTATHVLRAIDPTPLPRHADRHLHRRRVGAGRGRPAGAGRRPGRAARPPRPDRAPRRRRVAALAVGRRRADGRAAAAARPDGRGRHRAGSARAGRRRLRRSRRARLGAGDGQGDGQAGAGRQRHPPGPLPGVRRSPAHAADCPPSWPTSSACRASSSRPTWARRSACPRRKTVEELRDAIDARPDLRRVGGRRGGHRRAGDRGRRARRHRTRGLGAGEIVPGAEFYDYEDKYVTDGAQLLVPAPLHRGRVRRRAGAGRARLPGAALRRPGPRRLLLRGGRARLPVQRGQHDARLHADLDVPEAVAGRAGSATRS